MSLCSTEQTTSGRVLGHVFFRLTCFIPIYGFDFRIFSRPTVCMNVSNEFGIDSYPLILTGLQPRGGRVCYFVFQISLAYLYSVSFLDDNGTG